jgi:hypothetical protein
MKTSGWLRWVVAAALLMAVFWPAPANAQVPARFYWKSLAGGNAVPLIVMSDSGNANPFDPAHTVSAGATFDATLALAGYGRTLTLLDRAALVAVLMPMGRLSGEATVSGKSSKVSANGFGDPMVEFNINLIGPKAQKTIPDALRYEPRLSIDLLADLALPLGEYDNTTPLNIGQNRWYGRIGFPIVAQLGSWIPGRRTTLEFIPAVWLFGANNDFVGQTMTTEPSFQLDAHLTRDFAEQLWGSFDGVWYTGGKATVNGVPGKALNNLAFGITLGYTISDNLGFTVGYKSTVGDKAPEDLRMDGFTVSLVYGWHPIVEGSKRLKSEK